MKTLKRYIFVVLAMVMSLSFFACDSGSNSDGRDSDLVLNPIEGEISEKVDGNKVYETLTDRITPTLTFNESYDYDSWKDQVKQKFIQKLGIDKIEKNACDLDVNIEETVEVEANDYMPAHTRVRFVFNSEYGATVPCYLLIPKTGKASYPLAITLQGHAEEGFVSSVGIVLPNGSNKSYAEGRGAFAIQAVENGYIALAIEQRGMGERYAYSTDGASMCEFAAQQEFILGRTLLGGRVWDVSKALDALEDSVLKDYADKINMEDITITGNSGGGTASFYAACYDERITLSAPSCGFCTYEDSIMSLYHCSCNFIPGAYEWFDMQDLACLIAPRKLVVIAGAADAIFPIEGVDKAYAIVESIYEKAGVKDNCDMVTTGKNHYWVEDMVWDTIAQMRGE